MNCPKDKAEMKQISKDGIIIDFCPACRGVFLDRGELDKIIERSVEDYMESDSVKSKSGMADIDKTGAVEKRPSYLAGLFDLDISHGSVDSRTSYLKNDDIV